MNTHTVNAEKKAQRNVWIAAGVRTPFVRVDGPLTHRDSLTLSVPVARAMVDQVKGPIDFAVWGPVILNLAYNNLARELWLGIFYRRPERALVEALDRSFLTGAVAAGESVISCP